MAIMIIVSLASVDQSTLNSSEITIISYISLPYTTESPLGVQSPTPGPPQCSPLL